MGEEIEQGSDLMQQRNRIVLSEIIPWIGTRLVVHGNFWWISWNRGVGKMAVKLTGVLGFRLLFSTAWKEHL